MNYNIEKYVECTNKPIIKQVVKYYDYCQYTRHFTKNTMRGKVGSINHFLRFTGITDLKSISNDMIYEWMGDQTAQGNKPRTVNNRLKHLVAMLKYYRDFGMRMPKLSISELVKQHEEPPKRRAFTRDVVYEALKYADRDTWLMIKISFDCGLRINELRNIKLQDINGNQVEIIGKGRKRRYIILSNEVVVRLNDWIRRKELHNWLWPSKTKPNTPMTTETIRAKMRTAFECAGIYGFCPHELRHSYATGLKRLGASTRSIQMGLGHSSELTTENYLHDLDGSDLQELYALKYSAPAPEIR